MAKKPTPKTTTGRAKKAPATSKVTRKPADVEDHTPDAGAPIEHYRGERTLTDEHTGDVGSIEEETLDRDAPYNRTYGR